MNSTYWCWTVEQSDSSSLFAFLSNAIPHLKLEGWPERSRFGGLYLNGRRVIEDRPLPAPARIEYYEPKYPIEQAAEIFPKFSERFILWSDEMLAAVYKPNGLPSLPNREQGAFNLRRQLETHFRRSIHMPSRLDTSTRGVLVASIHPGAHGPLQRLFERREVAKRYLLQVSTLPNWEEKTVQTGIGRDPLHPVLRRVDPEGALAVTHFRLISKGSERAILEAKPLTGRTHQIRVHAHHLGLPIIGDRFYEGCEAEELHLFSERVSFLHPVSGKQIGVRVPDELRPEWCRDERIGADEAGK